MAPSAIKPTLQDLPSELLELILEYCNEGPDRKRDYRSLCLVNHRFRDITMPHLYGNILLRSWRRFVILMLSLQSDFPRRAGLVKTFTGKTLYPDPRDLNVRWLQNSHEPIYAYLSKQDKAAGRAILDLPPVHTGLFSGLESVTISSTWPVGLTQLINIWSAPRLKRVELTLRSYEHINIFVLLPRAPTLDHANFYIPDLTIQAVEALAAIRSTRGLSLWPRYRTSHYLMDLFAADLTNLELIFNVGRSPEQIPDLRLFTSLKTLRIDIMDLFQLNGCAGLSNEWETDPDYLEHERDSTAFVDGKLQLFTIPPPTLTHLIIEAAIWRVPHRVFETLALALVEQSSTVLPQLGKLELAILTQKWVKRWGKGVPTQIDKYIKWNLVTLDNEASDDKGDTNDIESYQEGEFPAVYFDGSARDSTCNCVHRSSEGIAALLRVWAVCKSRGVAFAVWSKGPWSHIKTWM